MTQYFTQYLQKAVNNTNTQYQYFQNAANNTNTQYQYHSKPQYQYLKQYYCPSLPQTIISVLKLNQDFKGKYK